MSTSTFKWDHLDLPNEIQSNMEKMLSDVHVNDEVTTIVLDFVKTGKRLRPWLLYKFLDESGISYSKTDALQLATAIEIWHQASLVIDDVDDNANTRDAGRMSVVSLLKNGESRNEKVITNQCARMMLWKGLISAGNIEDVSRKQKAEIVCAFATAGDNCISGEHVNSFLANPEYYSDRKWIDICLESSYAKTTSLLRLPCEIAGILIDTDEDLPETLGKFGEGVGKCYQSLDDLNDMDVDTNAGPAQLTLPLSVLHDDDQFQTDTRLQNALNVIPVSKYISSQESQIIKASLRNDKAYVAKRILDIITKLRSGLTLPSTYQKINYQVQNVLETAQKRDYWNYKT